MSVALVVYVLDGRLTGAADLSFKWKAESSPTLCDLRAAKEQP